MDFVRIRRRLVVSSLAAALSLAPLAGPLALAQDAPREEVDGLRITELVVARNIEGGQAVDPSATFTTADGRVMVLIRVENATGAETDLRVTFERADRELAAAPAGAAGVTLHVPAQRRYRTQARTGTRTAGRWRVVVRTAAGNVLGTAEYEVTAAS